MTGEEKNAPREWYLHGSKVFPPNGINGLINLNGPRLSDEVVHVIEYSAFEELKAEFDRTEAQNQRLRIDSKLDALNECRSECDELRAENERLLGANKGFAYVDEENSKLRERVAELSEALRSYASKSLWQEHQPCPDLGYEARLALEKWGEKK